MYFKQHLSKMWILFTDNEKKAYDPNSGHRNGKELSEITKTYFELKNVKKSFFRETVHNAMIMMIIDY